MCKGLFPKKNQKTKGGGETGKKEKKTKERSIKTKQDAKNFNPQSLHLRRDNSATGAVVLDKGRQIHRHAIRALLGVK